MRKPRPIVETERYRYIASPHAPWAAEFAAELERNREREATPPACGHSACRQHWIDTGLADCVAEPPHSSARQAALDLDDGDLTAGRDLRVGRDLVD